MIAAYSVKGGVGKTTAAVNLAWEAASRGFRVLVWDVDAQGSATYLLRVKPKLRGGTADLIHGESKIRKAVRETENPRIWVLPADQSSRDLELILNSSKKSTQRIEKALGDITDQFDVVILDCPPGASLLAENVLRAADVVVVPLQPSPLSLRALDQVAAIVAGTPKAPAVVSYISMADRRRGGHRAAIQQLPEGRADVTSVVVPATVVVEKMGELRSAVAEYAPRSEAAVAYAQLWRAVEKRAKLDK